MAKVIVGENIHQEPDKDIRFPPFLPGEKSKRYDSISGNTCNTKVYMIYNNR